MVELLPRVEHHLDRGILGWLGEVDVPAVVAGEADTSLDQALYRPLEEVPWSLEIRVGGRQVVEVEYKFSAFHEDGKFGQLPADALVEWQTMEFAPEEDLEGNQMRSFQEISQPLPPGVVCERDELHLHRSLVDQKMLFQVPRL